MHTRSFVISLWLVVMLCFTSLSWGQSEAVDEVLNRLALVTSDDENLDITTITDDLLYFAANPINLNATTKEDLERLPFLTSHQVEEILFYLYQYGEIFTLSELSLIDGLDALTIAMLQPFVCVAPLKESPLHAADVFKYGKHEILVSNHMTLEKQKGFSCTSSDLPADPSAYYLGDPIYASFKYNFHYKDRVMFGFSAEKDAGEAFTGPFHKGYDSYNAYLELRHFWRFKTIVAGNYRATFGQGLVLCTDFSMPSLSTTQISPRYTGLRHTSSTDEYYFLRGVGATLKFGRFSITPFYSYRHMDADTTGGSFSSITTTGLHRKVSELSHRRTLPMHLVGANVSYDGRHSHLGITSSTTIYALPQRWNGALYTSMLSTGCVQSALSVDYRFYLHKFNLFGETAICTNRGFATINAVSYSPASTVELLFSHRYYSPRYDVPFSNAYGGRTCNENGFYLGMQIAPVKHLRLSASADAYYRPWLSYSVDKSMVYYHLLLRADYSPHSSLSMLGQFTYRVAEKNLTSPTVMQQTSLVHLGKYLFRLSYEFASLNLQTRLEMNHARDSSSSPLTFGYLLSQSAHYTVPRISLSFDLLCAYFSAANYNNRFQIYERNVPYQMSLPLLYGEGVRYHFMIGYKAPRVFSIYARIAQTFYTDGRTTTGSGWDMISSNHKTDLHLLVRFSF